MPQSNRGQEIPDGGNLFARRGQAFPQAGSPIRQRAERRTRYGSPILHSDPARHGASSADLSALKLSRAGRAVPGRGHGLGDRVSRLLEVVQGVLVQAGVQVAAADGLAGGAVDVANPNAQPAVGEIDLRRVGNRLALARLQDAWRRLERGTQAVHLGEPLVGLRIGRQLALVGGQDLGQSLDARFETGIVAGRGDDQRGRQCLVIARGRPSAEVTRLTHDHPSATCLSRMATLIFLFATASGRAARSASCLPRSASNSARAAAPRP